MTGVDLSPEAIDRAQALAKELGIDARFLCADVLDPKELGDAQFDIVFTSYGALHWLPDLGAWARVIARHLKPDGRFHIVEFHPITSMLDEDAKDITSGYFNSGEALRFESTSSYAGGEHAPGILPSPSSPTGTPAIPELLLHSQNQWGAFCCPAPPGPRLPIRQREPNGYCRWHF